MHFHQLIFKKSFMLGFLTGTLFVLLVLWIFVFQYPLLLSSKAKASYSIGQQIGQNFKNQKFDISSIAFSAAMRDAMSDISRLNPSEIAEARRFLFSQTPQSEMLQKQMKLQQVDENGFFTLESGTKFKFLAEPKSRFKNKSELSRLLRPANVYRFHVTIVDENQNETLIEMKDKKDFIFKRQMLNSDLTQILDYLNENESMQAQLEQKSKLEISQLLKTPIESNQYLVIKRVKAK